MEKREKEVVEVSSEGVVCYTDEAVEFFEWHRVEGGVGRGHIEEFKEFREGRIGLTVSSNGVTPNESGSGAGSSGQFGEVKAELGAMVKDPGPFCEEAS